MQRQIVIQISGLKITGLNYSNVKAGLRVHKPLHFLSLPYTSYKLKHNKKTCTVQLPTELPLT